MSTPIWDQGDVLASVCATHCDRCDSLGRCLQLFLVTPRTSRTSINLCVSCFCELAYKASEKFGEATSRREPDE